MEVSVVITCWNGKNLLEKNLPLLFKAVKNSKNQIKEVIVVDDVSSDGSVDFLHQEFPQIKVITHVRNLGYGATCNTGVNAASTELVVILNADVIPGKNFLEPVLPLFKDNKLFAVTFNEGKFGPGKLEWKNGFLEIVPTNNEEETTVTSWPNGGSSIFRKELWEKLGGMNELFLPFYFEDVDLGIRATKAGYLCLWEPKAKINHEHEATINPKTLSFYNKNWDISAIKQRNYLLLNWSQLEDFNKIFEHFSALVKKCFLHPGYVKIVWLALKRKITFSIFHKK